VCRMKARVTIEYDIPRWDEAELRLLGLLEEHAIEIRLRAERRLDEIMVGQAKQ
jgi:hypothetical protein